MKKQRYYAGQWEHINGFTFRFWVFFNIWDFGISRREDLPSILMIGPLRFTLEPVWRSDEAAEGEMIWNAKEWRAQ